MSMLVTHSFLPKHNDDELNHLHAKNVKSEYADLIANFVYFRSCIEFRVYFLILLYERFYLTLMKIAS
jgi:hypothetical protein